MTDGYEFTAVVPDLAVEDLGEGAIWQQLVGRVTAAGCSLDGVRRVKRPSEYPGGTIFALVCSP